MDIQIVNINCMNQHTDIDITMITVLTTVFSSVAEFSVTHPNVKYQQFFFISN